MIEKILIKQKPSNKNQSGCFIRTGFSHGTVSWKCPSKVWSVPSVNSEPLKDVSDPPNLPKWTAGKKTADRKLVLSWPLTFHSFHADVVTEACLDKSASQFQLNLHYLLLRRIINFENAVPNGKARGKTQPSTLTCQFHDVKYFDPQRGHDLLG